jgi:hypothetical protein
MQAGQPLAFDAKVASKYLTDTCAKHGTVNIYVTIGKGTGKGASIRVGCCFCACGDSIGFCGVKTECMSGCAVVCNTGPCMFMFMLQQPHNAVLAGSC